MVFLTWHLLVQDFQECHPQVGCGGTHILMAQGFFGGSGGTTVCLVRCLVSLFFMAARSSFISEPHKMGRHCQPRTVVLVKSFLLWWYDLISSLVSAFMLIVYLCVLWSWELCQGWLFL